MAQPCRCIDPGQYLTVQVEVRPCRRRFGPYSISSAPSEDSYRISVKREALARKHLAAH